MEKVASDNLNVELVEGILKSRYDLFCETHGDFASRMVYSSSSQHILRYILKRIQCRRGASTVRLSKAVLVERSTREVLRESEKYLLIKSLRRKITKKEISRISELAVQDVALAIVGL